MSLPGVPVDAVSRCVQQAGSFSWFWDAEGSRAMHTVHCLFSTQDWLSAGGGARPPRLYSGGGRHLLT